LNGISFGSSPTTTTASTTPAADEPLTIDENGLVHLPDGSIVDTINRKRYKEGTTTVTTGGVSVTSSGIDWDSIDPTMGYLTSKIYQDIEGQFVGTTSSGTTTTTSETTDLPYFPTEPEIEKYFEDFEAIQIGNEVYYVPKSTEVEIRNDMVRPIDLTKVILNNKGQITAD